MGSLAILTLPGQELRWISGRFFLGVVEGCFCRGFCEKAGAARGVFVVSLWWIVVQTWSVEGAFSTPKNRTGRGNIFDPVHRIISLLISPSHKSTMSLLPERDRSLSRFLQSLTGQTI